MGSDCEYIKPLAGWLGSACWVCQVPLPSPVQQPAILLLERHSGSQHACLTCIVTKINRNVEHRVAAYLYEFLPTM
jgi:hypothetical protein